jgi:4'-phosphopantetheinyl transferase
MEWRTPQHPLEIKENHIDIWRAWLNLPEKVYRTLYELLSPDEKIRAEKFVFRSDQLHFIAARGFLRQILGAYTKTSPEEIQFSYGDYGKPFLPAHSSFQFNASHSSGLAVYAFSKKRRIGIDVERLHNAFDRDAVVEMFFTEEEKRLMASHNEDRNRIFLGIWTRKEAIAKAHGKGLALMSEKFNVSKWFIHPFRPHEHYIATLCAEGTIDHILFWQLPLK